MRPHSRERVRETAERGARADQEDEKSLGVDYATLDQILIAYVEEGKDVAAIVAESGLSRDLVDYVIARTDANAFKRALEPPYPDAPFYGAPASR